MKAGSLEASLDLRLGDVVGANKFFTAKAQSRSRDILASLAEIFIQDGNRTAHSRA